MKETEVLLKLRRKWSKDEEIAFMLQEYPKQLSEALTELGKLKSYVHELEDANSRLKSENKELRDTRLDDEVKKRLTNLESANKGLSLENSRLRKGEEFVKVVERANHWYKEAKAKQETINKLIAQIHGGNQPAK